MVSNTFTTHAERAPFLAMAEGVSVVETTEAFGSRHGVSEEVMAWMEDRFEPFAGAKRVGPAPRRSVSSLRP